MKFVKNILSCALIAAAILMPEAALADWGIVDQLNLAPFVPMVLDAMMMVATGCYEFFVGNGTGIIYILIWGFLAISLSLYLVKIHLPAKWVQFFGFSGGGDMSDGKATGMTIAQNVLKPALRAIIAAVVLLQIRPVYVTEWLLNPFLKFGSIYTHAIVESINTGGISGSAAAPVACPENILSKEWISQDSCEFLVQPVADLSHANNQMIKRGFDFVHRGLRGLITLIPHGGEDFMNLITGILLITTFVGCNLFMAMLIIQAIFKLVMSLILYPFSVLAWVANPKNSDRWFDIWPAFAGITTALQQLIITMIACAFILTINVAIIRALFQWNTSVFVVAAGGAATSNVPQVANTSLGFGGHSIMWMSAILTFYLMLKIFDMTRNKIMEYTGKGSDELYKTVSSDAKNFIKGPREWTRRVFTDDYAKRKGKEKSDSGKK